MDTTSRYWIGVASKDHVMKGVEGGFCQLCHGKSNPLKRLAPNDWIIYYSPRTAIDGGDPVQAFTAMGRIKEGESYLFDMGNGFTPHRRDVEFMAAQEASIRPLIENLTFIKNKKSWGYVFRFGLIEIPKPDFLQISAAMKVQVDPIA
jgi:EVE domain